MTPLEKALDALRDVQLLDNTPAEAKSARQDLVEILGDLYWDTLDQCPDNQ